MFSTSFSSKTLMFWWHLLWPMCYLKNVFLIWNFLVSKNWACSGEIEIGVYFIPSSKTGNVIIHSLKTMTVTQRGKVTCPRSHTKLMTECTWVSSINGILSEHLPTPPVCGTMSGAEKMVTIRCIFLSFPGQYPHLLVVWSFL